MSLFDAFKYDGKRVVVVGAATGMGNAAARLVQDAGAAELIALDIAAVDIAGATTGTINLADRASIEAAAAAVEGPIHALLSCSGVADGTPGIEKINFLGHRLFIELLIDSGKLGKGATIGLISSAAGLGWDTDEHLAILKEYLAIEDFDAASEWALANGKGDYQWSKRAVNAYVATQAYPMLKRGIRINAILPGGLPVRVGHKHANTRLSAVPAVHPLRQHADRQFNPAVHPEGLNLNLANHRPSNRPQAHIPTDGHGCRTRRPVPTPRELRLAKVHPSAIATVHVAPKHFCDDYAAQFVRLVHADAFGAAGQPDQQNIRRVDQVVLHLRHERPKCRGMVAKMLSVEEYRRHAVQAVQLELHRVRLPEFPWDVKDLAEPP